MKIINLSTLVVVILGGINWGIVGNGGVDMVTAILGAGSLMARAVHMTIGLAAIYQILPLIKAIDIDQPRAEASREI